MKNRCIAEGSLRIIFCFKLKVKDGMETKYNLFFKKKRKKKGIFVCKSFFNHKIGPYIS